MPDHQSEMPHVGERQVWHPRPPERRAFVVWLTGLSGAGKSTVAERLEALLHGMGLPTAILDGDDLRTGLNADLGFTDSDRTENVRRVAHVAALMRSAGLIVIVSLISPFRQDREQARKVIGPKHFIEVFVDAPFEICALRDPKGMYAKAMTGSLPHFTGIGSSYERPEQPDVHLRTDVTEPDIAVKALIDALARDGFLEQGFLAADFDGA